MPRLLPLLILTLAQKFARRKSQGKSQQRVRNPLVNVILINDNVIPRAPSTRNDAPSQSARTLGKPDSPAESMSFCPPALLVLNDT